MPDKRIRFSSHAEQRRKQRGLSEMQIVETIKRPGYVKKMPDGRKVAVRTISNRTITVVYLEEENVIRVITVF
ncbi:MAG: DUF4258 domain-containing protein [Thaumarchaeota archaeon]|nr:DUF4258 domain-containing protein [Nitrososphaerota archaeon]